MSRPRAAKSRRVLLKQAGAYFEDVNARPDDAFLSDYILPYTTKWGPWTHPTTGARHDTVLASPKNMTDDELEQCLSLVAETSAEDYRQSSLDWEPTVKRAEMRTAGLRYVLLRDEAGDIVAFTSFMPTIEEGFVALFCYEIHLKPQLQGAGLGKLLMSFVVAAGDSMAPPVEKVMLRCFVRNTKALAFYRGSGFSKDETSPEPIKLRSRVQEPDFMVLSRAAVPRPEEC